MAETPEDERDRLDVKGGAEIAWIVWSRPYYGRSDHARVYDPEKTHASDTGLCGAAPVRWVSRVGSEARPERTACNKCDEELERLRLLYGPDYLRPPAGRVEEAPKISPENEMIAKRRPDNLEEPE